MKIYSIILFLILFTVSFASAQVVLKEQPINIRLDDLASYEKEGFTFSINKAQKKQGGIIPIQFSIIDSIGIYVITSTGFAYGRGYLKEDCKDDQYCEPLLRAQNPISYWNLVVPAYSTNIPESLYLSLNIRKYITETKTWEKNMTRIPISFFVKE